MEQELAKKQKELNKLYEKHGLKDEILDLQIEINKLRHEHDIPDKSDMIHDKFVQ